MQRYAAKILMQYRPLGPKAGKYRTCEERITLVTASTPDQALSLAKKSAKATETRIAYADGESVAIEFVGILQLIHLGPECEADQVWYEMKVMKQPMERKRDLVPKRKDLAAFKR